MVDTGRHAALKQCFQRLDADQSGFIDLQEARALAQQATPQLNSDDAKDLFKFADQDHDNLISFQEFSQPMLLLTEPLSDQEFAVFASLLMGPTPSEALTQPGYKHPQGSREWLDEQVVPLLRQGLQQLVAGVVKQRLQLASGQQWEVGSIEGEGGDSEEPYLAHGWQPFSPLKWLGEWLLTQLPEEVPLTPGTPVRFKPPPGPTFSALNREAKAALAFSHLDRDGSGYLDHTELLAVAGKLRKEQDAQFAQELLETMDQDGNGRVELEEYVRFVLSLTKVLSDPEFDAAMHKVMGANHLSYCTSRADRLRFLYQELDQERLGVVSVDDVVQAALRLDPAATPWTVQTALDIVTHAHRRSSHSEVPVLGHPHVDVDMFVATMTLLVTGLDEEELEGHIVQMMEGRKLGMPVKPANPLDEVEPLKFQDMLRSLPLLEHLVQVATSEVVDAVDDPGVMPLVLVDVREEEEWAVSCIPGALHIPLEDDHESELGWTLGNVQTLRSAVALSMAKHGRPPRIVAYCSSGSRSGPASIELGKTLGITVRSLCGGIISYYNQGGRVKDPVEGGREVQAVHPGSSDLKAFVTRPSAFKLI